MNGSACEPSLLEKATLTRARVHAGLEAGQVPMVSQIVQIIKDISGKADRLSVSDLADCISREPATMSRIITIAGSLGYNPNGLPVTSLAEAVAVVGFERVRSLSIQVLLLDNTQSVRTGKNNRDLAALCLVSGLFAAELCHPGVPVEPDLAFLCGALRNYGRMLLATFMPGAYQAAVDRAANHTDDSIYRSIFGLTPLRLAREILAELNLPALVLNSLERADKDIFERANQDPAAALITVCDFGLSLAESLLASPLTQRNYLSRLEALSGNYPSPFHLSKDAAKELVEDVAARIQTFGVRAGTSLEPAMLLRRLDCLAHNRPLPRIAPARRPEGKPPAPAPAVRPHPSPAKPPKKRVSAGQTARVSQLFKDKAIELARLLDAPKPAPKRVVKLMAQTLQKGLKLSSCVVFLKDGRTGLFRFSHGLGSIVATARTQALDPNQRTIFSVPLKRGEDVLIENPQDPGISPFIPDWLKHPGHAMPLLLLPVRDEHGPFALILAVGTSLSNSASAARVSAELAQLRAQAARLGQFLRD